MAIDAKTLEDSIRSGIPDAQVRIEDLRGDGDHYAAYITSASFAGKTRVQQHQMVYKALGDTMDSALHALAIQTLVPSEEG